MPLFRLDWDEPEEPAPAPPPRAVDPVTGDDPEHRLAERLKRHLATPLASVVLTDNRRRIVSARPTPEGLALRIHRAFTTADEATLAAVATIVGGRATAASPRGESARRAATERLRRHHEEHAPAPPPRRRRPPLVTRGEVHDLAAIHAAVAERYFDPASPVAVTETALPEVAITWGRTVQHRRRGRTVSMRLGSYDGELALVRIHPALDCRWVPAWVVEFVVFHELLHAVLPPERRPGKRRRIHSPELRRRERLHPRFAEAERWIADHLLRLTGEASRRR